MSVILPLSRFLRGKKCVEPLYVYLDLHCLVFQFSTRNNMHDPDSRFGLFLYLICFKGLKVSV